MLDDLLTIKRRREDDAIAALHEAGRVLEQRRAECEAKRQEFERYKVWRKEEAERLFDKVKQQEVPRSALERYRQDVALLQQREYQMQEELAAAEREVKAAEANLDQAKAKRTEAHKEVVKFEEYQKQLLDEAAAEANRKEEAEIEDIVGSRRS